jgi:hypothetical protein
MMLLQSFSNRDAIHSPNHIWVFPKIWYKVVPGNFS